MHLIQIVPEILEGDSCHMGALLSCKCIWVIKCSDIHTKWLQKIL